MMKRFHPVTAMTCLVGLPASVVPAAAAQGDAATCLNTATQRESGFANGQFTPFRQIPNP